MAFVVVIGAQWGDEGKGKIVDLLTPEAEMVVRFGGGANAGHTLVVGGEKVILRLIPSGALHPKAKCVLGPGVVIDLEVLSKELEILGARGLLPDGRIFISERAQVVLPHHPIIDALRERGAGAIGTTKRGIGPAYEDKVGRRGVRVSDLLDPERLRARLTANLAAWAPVLDALGGEAPAIEETITRLTELGQRIAPMIGDTTSLLLDARAQGKSVLFEGAQGTMLDIDHGSYPYVTSSTVISGGACAGSGIAPTHIDRVVGITKAYTTRVGEGPFPTELYGEEGEELRRAGGEFGAVTGRPRRCGWLDLAVLRHAVRINGITELAITKLDVLSGREKLKVCVGYRFKGKPIEHFPSDRLDDVEPIYEELDGWTEDVSNCRKLDELPDATRRYIAMMEQMTGARATVISVGPDREQTIQLGSPFRARG